MPSTHQLTITRRSDVVRSPRVMQLEGMFDLPAGRVSEQSWALDFELPDDWSVGLIVGPSGAGKSTVAHELFGDAMVTSWPWTAGASVVDGFPKGMSIKDITALLSSVGFSSPPAWLRPFDVLSNGEQFRVTLARILAEQPQLAVVDEFTSVVDRTVAQIGSAAVAKTVRSRKQRFVAVSCHYDIAAWLTPDWIFEPHLNKLTRGSLRRPPITLTIERCATSLWEVFRKHHYLNHDLNPSAQCFLASWKGIPVAFSAWLPMFGHKNWRREHRTVTLPDYQGVGIGNALSATIASMWRGLGMKASSTTTHPAMIRARQRSPLWVMHSAPKTHSAGGKNLKIAASMKFASNRLAAGFTYVGLPMDRADAQRLADG